MLVRQIDAANVTEARQDYHHFLRSLNDIHRSRHRLEQEMGNADRPTTRMQREDLLAGEDKLVAGADLVTRPGLQDRIVEIGGGKRRLSSGGAELVVGNAPMGGVRLHRSGPARRWNEHAGI